jgi:hypothetical protein
MNKNFELIENIIKTYNFHEVCEIKLENETPIFDYYNDKKLDKLCSLDKGVYLWVLKENNKPFEIIYVGLLDKSTLKGRNGFHGNGFKDKGGSKSGKKLKDGIYERLEGTKDIKKAEKIVIYTRHSVTRIILGEKEISLCRAEEFALIKKFNNDDNKLLNEEGVKRRNIQNKSK